MAHKQNVLVTLCGTSQAEGETPDEPIRLMTTGTLEQRGEEYILIYEESQTDEGTGAIMTQEIELSMQPGRVTMTRKGDFGTSMVFVKDRRFEGAYRTPYGDLDMAVYATQVSCRLSPAEGHVRLQYQLDMQGMYASMHTMELTYTAGESRSC